MERERNVSGNRKRNMELCDGSQHDNGQNQCCVAFRIPYKLRSPVHRPLPQCRQPPRLEVDRPEHDQLGHHSRDDREQAVHRLQDQWGVAHQALIAFRIPALCER